jgi:LEA14-like dessication related protein
VRSELDVTNPNSFPLVVRSVDGRLLVGSGIEVGKGTLPSGAKVPAHGTERVVGDMALPWSNLAAFAPLAVAGKPVPYTFEGTANVGGDTLNFDVPFKIRGEITADQLLSAGLRGFQGIPGFH